MGTRVAEAAEARVRARRPLGEAGEKPLAALASSRPHARDARIAGIVDVPGSRGALGERM